MVVKVWGVRGTIPVPGGQTIRYGGNTPCLSVEIEDRVLVLDAGSGIRGLGNSLFRTEKEIYILISHPHADHIQGLPFFAPFYESGRTVHVLDYDYNGFVWSPLEMFDRLHMPILASELPGNPRRVQGDVMAFLNDHGFAIDRLPVNHPGGAYGYRIRHSEQTLVYITDNELGDPDDEVTPHEAIVDFCRGADLFFHDAQYLREEMPLRRGWGHSVVFDACTLAVEAGVKQFRFFHHDPARTDEALDAIERKVKDHFDATGVVCQAAREGCQFDL